MSMQEVSVYLKSGRFGGGTVCSQEPSRRPEKH